MNAKELGEEPAFPLICDDISKYQVFKIGLTTREWLAGMAMQGMIACAPERATATELLDRPTNIASWSVMYADALLSELAKK